jgi:RNA polymerase sigma factor (TIGR02999 family)
LARVRGQNEAKNGREALAEICRLLAAARLGDEKAAGEIFGILYQDLRRLAKGRLRQHQTMTLLDTTALVHESFLKLVGTARLPVDDQHHFFAYASQVMRSVIVDYARARQAERRGGAAEHVALDTVLMDKLGAGGDDIIRVHEALGVLAEVDKDLAQLVEMRYFGGLTETEIGEVLGLSMRTVRRNWTKARVMLAAAL